MTPVQRTPAGPERAAWPFGPKTRAWLKQFMPIAEYGAKCVAESEKASERAREMAMSEQLAARRPHD